jgi:hypothetical protein
VLKGSLLIGDGLRKRGFSLFLSGRTSLRKETAVALKCNLLDDCGFIKKYQPTEDMACRWFIQEYCRGTRMAKCKRKEYFQQRGTQPSDDMMPSGKNAPRQHKP